ncbi:extended synaptotagmin-2 isoform X2 [Alosa sapidissima]|uniref:extended synaptotagmin-2 isoform X2 n=1 Tax=Alosa sapidissima TaxID=34773 RepID=UPI001C09EFAC|nr:extended synaptotagmin-2 isoform X2 [Alosa sapidissima]
MTTEGQATRPDGPVSAPPSPVSPLAPVEPDDEPQSSITDATQAGIKFAKTFALIFPIYVVGYLELSFSWVLIGLALLFWWRRTHGHRNTHINRALAFFEHKEKAVRQSLPSSELPPWVHFPDVERVEWLNKTVKQMWPFICQFVDKLFRETIEPAVKGANTHLSSFCFTKIDMGDKPLRVNGVKVYTENVDKRQIIMDLQISFVGNTEIDVDIQKYYCRAGIKSIQLHGVLRVVMEPLLGDMPLIGALSVFFLKKPLLDINWTGLTNMLDIPGLNDLCDNIIQDIIYSYLVLPNKISIPLVGETQLAKLRFPMPKGVLRVHFLEAQDLVGKDKFLGGLIKGKSDPYGVIQVANQLFQSRVIKENVNPRWNEVYEALVYDHPGQSLDIELFDEDTDKDDFLGSLTIDVAELEKQQRVDEWFQLEEVASGKLHLKLEWLSLLPAPDKLDQVLSGIKAEKGQADDGLSSALLLVHLDSAKHLPGVFEGTVGVGCLKERRSAGLVFCENTSSLYRSLFSGKKVTSDPSPFVQFTVGHKSYESKTRYKTNEPVWEEAFTFLIHNPKTQQLEVEVKDEKHECTLGTLSLPVSQLLDADQMTLNQRFPLNQSGPSATLKMKMALRVLRVEKLDVSNQPSSVQIRRSSVPPTPATPLPSSNTPPQVHTHPPEPVVEPAPAHTHPHTPSHTPSEPPASPRRLEQGRSMSSLAISDSLSQFNKEPTPSIASDISAPYATQELQHRLEQLHNGSPSSFPLGEVQLTVRHSSQRNKLIVVVHACRNLIAFTDSGSDPYVRLYLLPDKRRSGRRKTHTFKKTLNPVYDQTFEFSVSIVELHRRTLDVAVKNGGGILSKHKGLLGKVLVDLSHEVISKGWTQWYELSEDGLRKPSQL